MRRPHATGAAAPKCVKWLPRNAGSRCPKRNGGRHCCQPPLRRAKDMPVFVTWSMEPCGLPTRSRSWLTSSGVASHHLPEPGGLVQRCSTALLGSITLASRFASRDPKTAGSRVALEEDRLFRRLFPAGPASTPERVLALPAGRDRTFGHLPHPSCRFRPSGEAGTAVPITHSPCTSRPSRQSEKSGEKPVDNGDIGNNRWNLLATPARRPDSPSADGALRLPFRSPPPNSARCPKPLPLIPSPPICRA